MWYVFLVDSQCPALSQSFTRKVLLDQHITLMHGLKGKTDDLDAAPDRQMVWWHNNNSHFVVFPQNTWFCFIFRMVTFCVTVNLMAKFNLILLYFFPLIRAKAPKGSQMKKRGLHRWTPGALTPSHWRDSRWTSSKFTNVLSVASLLRTMPPSTSTSRSTSRTARPSSVRSVACATPPPARWPDTSSLSIGWRSPRVLAGTTEGAKEMRRVKEKTSWMWQTRTMTGHPTQNVKCAGRSLRRRETWTLTWGHTGWRS